MLWWCAIVSWRLCVCADGVVDGLAQMLPFVIVALTAVLVIGVALCLFGPCRSSRRHSAASSSHRLMTSSSDCAGHHQHLHSLHSTPPSSSARESQVRTLRLRVHVHVHVRRFASVTLVLGMYGVPVPPLATAHTRCGTACK